jgi:hypothetical protein
VNYDRPPSEIPIKPKGFDGTVLWIVVGLFLALGIAWLVYPRIYLHYHPGVAWPAIPQRWRAYSDSSPSLVYFLLACMTAAFGFWQIRFHRWFACDSSRILSWLYLLFSLVFVAGSWTFDLGSHFWTISMQNEFYPPDRVLEIGRILIKVGLYSGLAAAVLNVNYSGFRDRRT